MAAPRVIPIAEEAGEPPPTIHAPSALRMHRTAPRADTTLQPLDEHAYTSMIAAHHGHVVIVDFWATWCSPCREEMPGVIALAKRYEAKGVQKGVQLATISADLDEQMHEAVQFLDSVQAPKARYIKHAVDDDRFIQTIDSTWSGALPALFVYDRAGRKVRAFFGETPIDSLAAAVRKAAGS